MDGGIVVDGDDGVVGTGVVDLLQGGTDVVGLGTVEKEVGDSGVIAFEEDVAIGFRRGLSLDGENDEMDGVAGREQGFGEMPCAQGLSVEHADIRCEEWSSAYEEDSRHG